jgi:hypothetical protein
MPTAEPRIDERGLELLERDELLDRLASALEAAATGHGRLVLLGGEAGVGKTALLRTFCTADASPGCCGARASACAPDRGAAGAGGGVVPR